MTNINERLTVNSAWLLRQLVTKAECIAIGCQSEKYGSPIERAMAISMAMHITADQIIGSLFEYRREFGLEVGQVKQLVAGLPAEGGFIFPQVKIGQYRADFLMAYKTGTAVDANLHTVVIECDGHAFHERHKDQVARDRARDRYLQINNYKVMRFTGSEIFHDPHACASQILIYAANCILESIGDKAA